MSNLISFMIFSNVAEKQQERLQYESILVGHEQHDLLQDHFALFKSNFRIVGEQNLRQLVGDETLGQFAKVELDRVGNVERRDLLGRLEVDRLAFVDGVFQSVDACLVAVLAEQADLAGAHLANVVHGLEYGLRQRLACQLHHAG